MEVPGLLPLSVEDAELPLPKVEDASVLLVEELASTDELVGLLVAGELDSVVELAAGEEELLRGAEDEELIGVDEELIGVEEELTGVVVEELLAAAASPPKPHPPPP